MPSAGVSSSTSSSSTRSTSPTNTSNKSSTNKSSKSSGSSLKGRSTKSKTNGVAARSAEAEARVTKSSLKNNGGITPEMARAAFEAKNGDGTKTAAKGQEPIDKAEFDTQLAERARNSNIYSAGPGLDAVKSGSANLQVGHKGEAVKDVQRALNERGANLKVDGYLGPKTEAALKTFQNDQGLSPNGIVDKHVAGKLSGPAKTLSQQQWNHFSPDYGTTRSAAGPGPADKKVDTSAPAGPATGKTASFLNEALSQKGKQYIFGAEVSAKNNNPKAFDCSELVEWAAKRAGGYMPDGSANQRAYVQQKGTQMSVSEAIKTPGALLFRPGHVAISLGDGRTIEARGRKYGVGIFNAQGRFTSAGMIPGMN